MEKTPAQIVTDLSVRIIKLLDDAGASDIERRAAIDIASTLVDVDEDDITSVQPDDVAPSRSSRASD